MEEHLEGQGPTKAVFFVWTATFGIIMTIDNLSKRHILLADWYCMCKGCGNTLDRFLLHCLTTTDVWSFISMLLGLAWWCPNLCMRCWRVGKDNFKATGLLLCGKICPYVLCGFCGTEEIGRSLMVLSDLLMLSRSKPYSPCLIGCLL